MVGQTVVKRIGGTGVGGTCGCSKSGGSGNGGTRYWVQLKVVAAMIVIKVAILVMDGDKGGSDDCGRNGDYGGRRSWILW